MFQRPAHVSWPEVRGKSSGTAQRRHRRSLAPVELVLAALFLVACTPLLAQSRGSSSQRPTLSAVSLATEPELDGNVLDDAAWADVAGSESFVQTTPNEGTDSSERTEVRVGYTEDTLFIAVICYDREPDRIIVSDSRRDASLTETDSVQLVIDTYGDQQNGFVFGTNPAGIEYDGQVRAEGQGGFGGGRFRGGSGGGFNLNWDASWRVATRTAEHGWSAEFAIPFTTLRYPSSENQVWGLNVQRNIRRHNERAFWAPLDRNHSLYRLSAAGTLEDVQAPPQRNLQLIPYALGQGRDAPAFDDTETDSEVGLDVKWGITPSLTLDATLNTDFAQVEVDEQQINLDRFNLFFPEKRPFFLENAGLFSVGSPGEVELFFSRRIGIGPGGVQIPIDWGLRLTGKVGNYNVGVLDMETDEVGGVASNNFGVARLSRDLPNRSSIGALYVRRDGEADSPGFSDRNETFALDGRWGIGEHFDFSAFVAQTDSPLLDGGDHAYRFRGDYSSPEWRIFAEFMEVGENFNPEVGFLSREAFRKASGLLWRTIRPPNAKRMHEYRPHISYSGYWDLDDFHVTGFLHVDNHFEWKNGYEVHTGINFLKEGLKQPFEIFDGVVIPAGTYNDVETQLVFITNQGADVSFSLRSFIGGFFGGDRVRLSPTLRMRAGEKLTSELGITYNDIDLPGGDFETTLGRLRVSYSFTPKLLLQALIQYNDVNDDVSTNLRFSWLRTANTGLYVVYNEINEFGRFARDDDDRTLVVKYSYLFDVFGRR